MVLEGSITDNYKMDEQIVGKEQNPAEMSSQECVEGMSKISNMMWTSIRNAHKRSKDNNPLIGGMYTGAHMQK
jgi:hypothetical protein